MAVIEVGLGGRLDSTNVIMPELAIITNIALDHAEYLGNTIESIAREKAGIIKPGIPVFTAEDKAAALDIFREAAGDRLTRVHAPTSVSFDASGTRFMLDDETFHTPLIGAHQALNTALAIRACAGLADPPSKEAIKEGVAAVRWPGRMQIHQEESRTWVFDVAHNVAGVHALVRAVTDLGVKRPLVVVVGILGDKDWKAMLPPLFELADEVVVTRPPTAPANRTWEPERVLREVQSGNAHLQSDFTRALEQAVQLAGNGTILVTGSFHTVGDALIALDITPFGTDIALPRVRKSP